jgi:hypothetical protein
LSRGPEDYAQTLARAVPGVQSLPLPVRLGLATNRFVETGIAWPSHTAGAHSGRTQAGLRQATCPHPTTTTDASSNPQGSQARAGAEGVEMAAMAGAAPFDPAAVARLAENRQGSSEGSACPCHSVGPQPVDLLPESLPSHCANPLGFHGSLADGRLTTRLGSSLTALWATERGNLASAEKQGGTQWRSVESRPGRRSTPAPRAADVYRRRQPHPDPFQSTVAATAGPGRDTDDDGGDTGYQDRQWG